MFTLEWLRDIFPNCELNNVPLTAQIGQVSTDSRGDLANALFVPLSGDRFDGHDFAEKAVQGGAIAIIWNRKRTVPAEVKAKAAIFYCDDTLLALQDLASQYREKINPTVIGITGSNGKTTTKDLVAAVLKTKFKTHHTKGNLNNHIGVPLTILSMSPDTEMLIVEMGMNHAGEIEALSKIAQPDYAIITNIGESHIEYLGSRAGIAAAKLEIATGLKPDGYLIIDGDEPLLESVRDAAHTITCGFAADTRVHISKAEVGLQGTDFELAPNEHFQIPLYGKHHAKNAVYAVSLAQLLGISNELIQTGFASLEMTGMRFQWLKGQNGATLINDAYNASPTSMKGAIDVVREIGGFQEIVLVLGDIFELGNQAEAMHQSVAPAIKPPVNTLFTYGKDTAVIAAETNRLAPSIQTAHFTEVQPLVEALQPCLHQGALILFKGSRGMKMEQIIDQLVEKQLTTE